MDGRPDYLDIAHFIDEGTIDLYKYLITKQNTYLTSSALRHHDPAPLSASPR